MPRPCLRGAACAFPILLSARRWLAAWLLCMAGVAAAQVTPVPQAVSPSQTMPQVASVTLTGAQLQQAGFTTTVRFGGVLVPPGDMLAVAPERVVVLAPPGAGTPVTVSVGGATSAGLPFNAVTAAFASAEVVAALRPGGTLARVVAVTGLELRSILPLGETTLYRFGIPDARGITQAIRDLFATGLVQHWRSANFRYEALALPSRHNQQPPNDAGFAQAQWGPQRIRVVDSNEATPDAHRLSRGNGITIAVVDTGVSAHEDLIFAAGTNFTVPPGDPNRNNVDDDSPHGTHVAGIAAARTNNGIGIAGVAPQASLFATKVLGGGALGNFDTTIADGIRDAAGRAQVINLSLGGPARGPAVEAAVNFALGRKRVVVVASGNGGRLNGPDTACFPAALSDVRRADGIVAVGNTTEADQINAGTRNPGLGENACNFAGGGSTRGPHVDVSAPGTEICSSVPAALPGDPAPPRAPPLCRAPLNAVAQPYRSFTGTSMATPHVSGVAALMLERDPRLNPGQVECLLRATSVDLGPRGRDDAFGDGRVDAYAAVLSVISLNGRYELLPRDCAWVARGGPPPVPPIPPIPPPRRRRRRHRRSRRAPCRASATRTRCWPSRRTARPASSPRGPGSRCA